MEKFITEVKNIDDAGYGIIDINRGLCLSIIPEFYAKIDADKIFEQIEKTVIYDKNSKIIIYGKEILIPRQQVAFGDPGTNYKFSGVQVDAKPWIPIISKIRDDIEIATGIKYNFCLVNRYTDGTNYIGYHKDDEKDLDAESDIVSVSFGATRQFYFKYDNKLNGKNLIKKVTLKNGTVCMMHYPTNQHWKHSVPKEAHVKDPRINLTFRKILIN